MTLSKKNIIVLVILFLAIVSIFVFSCKFNKCIKGENNMKKTEATLDTIFGKGEKNPYGKFFTGQTYLQKMMKDDTTFTTNIANVVFEPGARTNWHSHTAGQILLVLDGEGRYQEKYGEIRILKKGDVVEIVPDVIHWHGAAPDSWFVHVSITPDGANNKTTWMEPVNNEEYR